MGKYSGYRVPLTRGAGPSVSPTTDELFGDEITVLQSGKQDATFTSAVSGAGARSVSLRLRETVRVTDDSRADPTGVGDSGPAIQAAIDYCASLPRGGRVEFPSGTYKTGQTLVPKSNVRLVGLGGNGITNGTVLQMLAGAPSGVMFQTAANISSFTLDGFYLLGKGGAANGTCFDGSGYQVLSCEFRNLRIENFGTNGIWCGNGNKNTIAHCQILMGSYVPAAYSAAVKFTAVGGTYPTESFIYCNELSGGVGSVGSGTKSDANLYKGALLIEGSGFWIRDNICEFGDYGVRLYGTGQGKNRVASTTADNCVGHGWLIESSFNKLVNCNAHRCGHDTNNTYYGFNTTGFANRFTGCDVTGASDAARVHSGFYDNSSSGFDKAANIYKGCVSNDHVTTMFRNAAGARRAAFDMPFTNEVYITGATPDVGGCANVAINDTTPITDFLGGVRTQRVLVHSAVAGTITHHATKMITIAGANLSCPAGSESEWECLDGTNWKQRR